ncbi:hypothetical protein QBC43DRAFT_312144 [Cladorrhinum sp. PSN259]|nr:hypothetical protein QBC43DRAFT_312144 [Cladorrhinum sp. PSN259]
MADGPPPPPLRPERPKTTIEIPLPSIRKYVGGSGPPLAKISLAPPRDSTAYIIDQFVLPTPASTTENSRRLIHYNIGFTDLPAAKILVPCDKILDYVSPREFEDWEYKNFDRRMEERAQEEARKKAELQAKAAKKKKPGRPAKVNKAETAPSKSGSPEDDSIALTEAVAGPSLSTPQKRKLSHVLNVEDFGDTASHVDSEDAAIQLRLQKEARDDDEMDEDMGMEIGSSGSVDQLPLPFEASGEDTSSRASSLVPPQKDIPLLPPAPPRTEPGRPKTTPIPPPQPWKQGDIHSAWAQSIRQQARPDVHKADVRQLTISRYFASPTSADRPPSRSKDSMPSHSTPATTAPRSGVVSNWGSINKRKTPPLKTPSEKPFVEPPTKLPKITAKTKTETPKMPKTASEQEWEVKELLNDAWVFENGASVHKYLVQWVGDWPPDQNPTWEPKANIADQDLIRRYEEKKKNKINGSAAKKKKKQKPPGSHLKSPYSSVAEAFEGDLALQGEALIPHVESDSEELHKEEFLVTEEPNRAIIISSLKKPAAAKQTFKSTEPVKAPVSFPRFEGKLAHYKHNYQSYHEGPKR